MDKLEIAEAYVDALLLEQFNPSHLISNAMGHYNVGWTQCYENRCAGQELAFDKELCKQGCIISSASSSIAEIAGGRGKCGQVKKPSSCIKRLDKGIDKLRDKITKARVNQRKARDKKAEYLRKMAGGA
jgi:hypothetical protein